MTEVVPFKLYSTYIDNHISSQSKYYPNGHLLSRVNYHNNELEGYLRRWYEDGRLMSCDIYHDGQCDGPSNWWYPDGTPAGSCTYIVGELHGDYKTWYADGTLKCHAVYFNGTLKHCTEWSVDGKVLQKYSTNIATK